MAAFCLSPRLCERLFGQPAAHPFAAVPVASASATASTVACRCDPRSILQGRPTEVQRHFAQLWEGLSGTRAHHSRCQRLRRAATPEGADASRDPLAALEVGSEAPTAEPRVAAPADEDEPWTPQRVVAIISGIVGSMIAAFTFSQQREAAKSKAHVEGSAKGVRIVQQLGGSLLDLETESPLFSLGPVPTATEESDLRRPGRHYTIITTAALPWLTGTSVNPLLRAIYLARRNDPVVLMIPWLDRDDQMQLFPNGQTFETPADQLKIITAWCTDRAKMDLSKMPLQFRWYSARYVLAVRSIFPNGDISRQLGEDDPRDVLILEEPEHLCWFHHGQRWPTLFRHVIGIVHTNYMDYIVAPKCGDTVKVSPVPDSSKEAFIFASSALVCSAYCDVNIKLSDTIMPLPNEVTCNVHGVRQEFLNIGDAMGTSHADAQSSETTKVYYLGKALFEKGWNELLTCLEGAGPLCRGVEIDGYGSGADYELIIQRAKKYATDFGEDAAHFTMHPGLDHANEVIHKYGVLVNPSTTDVLCTVTVEALAMGKRAVLAKHPSNRFFEELFADRCFFFNPGDHKGFVAALLAAVEAGPPQALPAEQRYILTWEAASERLCDASAVRVLSGIVNRPSDVAAARLAYQLHNDLWDDKNVLADVIKDATIGEGSSEFPWNEYLSEWRNTQMGKLRQKAEEYSKFVLERPQHLREHGTYLRDRIREIAEFASIKSDK